MARVLDGPLQGLPTLGIAVQDEDGGAFHDARKTFFLDRRGPVKIVIPWRS
jgi:hypothetical protein